MADTRARHRARAHPLAAPQLLRLLPDQLVVPVDPRRPPDRRSRGAGDELGHQPGLHRSGDADGRLDAGAARPARVVPLDQRQRRRRDPRIGQRGDTRIDPGRPMAHHTGGAVNARRRHLTTRRICDIAGALAASRRACASPASAPIASGSCHTTTAFAMQPRALAEMIAADRAAGLIPFWVCSSHGTTARMAFDPTAAIAEIAQREGMWLHVDAAMSGIAALAPEYRWVNDGLEHRRQLLHQPAQVDGRQLRLRPVLDGRSRRAARRAEHPARVPAIAGGRERRRHRLPRLADPPRTPLPCAEAVVHLRIDGVDAVQADDPPHMSRSTQLLAEWVSADDRFEIVAPHPLNLLCLVVTTTATRRPTRSSSRPTRPATVLFTRTVLDGRSVPAILDRCKRHPGAPRACGVGLLQQLL